MGYVTISDNVNRHQHVSVYRDDGTCQHIHQYSAVEVTEELPIDDSVNVCVDFDVYKAREEEQLVSGWANVAINKDGSIPLDWQDDVISPATLEKAAINFMMDYRGSGVMHEGESKGTVVESIVLTKEKQAAIGIPEGCVPEGWFITVKVHDPEVFAKVKDGTYRMFSIQGSAKRVKL